MTLDSQPGTDYGSGPHPERLRWVFLLLLVTGISFLFLVMIRPFVMTLLMAGLFSGLLQPLYRSLHRRFGERSALASAVTIFLFIFLLLAPLAVFLGVVAQQAIAVSQSVTPWVADVQQQLNEPGGFDRLIESLPFAEQVRPYQTLITERVGSLAASIGTFVVAQLAAVTRGTVWVLFLLSVMLYSMFFFLKDGEKILEKILYYLPLSSNDEHRLLGKFVSVSRAMVKGTFLIGIIQGILAGAAFWVAGIPSVAFWSTVMAVLSIIPGVGAALIWVPAGIYLLTVGQVGAGIGVMLWCAIVVGLVDNLLRPWLVGRDTQMPDLMILLGTLGGLAAFGAAGVLIGPIIAALFLTVWELYGEAFKNVLPVAFVPPVAEPPEDVVSSAESGDAEAYQDASAASDAPLDPPESAVEEGESG